MKKHYYQLDYSFGAKASPGHHKMLSKVRTPKKSIWNKFKHSFSFFGTDTKIQRKINSNLLSFSIFMESFEKNIFAMRRKKAINLKNSMKSSEDLHLSLMEIENLIIKEKKIKDYQITLIRKSVEAVLETLAEFSELNKERLDKELKFNLSYSVDIISDILPKICLSKQKRAYLEKLMEYSSSKLKL